MSCSSGFLPVLSAVDKYGIISDEVPVAQWIERAPPERETAGSSPVGDALILRPQVRVRSSALNLVLLCPASTCAVLVLPWFPRVFKSKACLSDGAFIDMDHIHFSRI